MRVADMERSWREAATDLDGAPLERVGEAVLAWYVAERVEDAALDDGDMLLFQWGEDGTFYYDLTRQVVTAADDPDDQEIWQLSVTAHYPASVGAGVGSGNRWCAAPDDVAELRAFLERAPATRAVAGVRPLGVEVTFDRAD